MSHTEASLSSELSALLVGKVDDPESFSVATVQAFVEFTAPRIDGEMETNFNLIIASDPTAGGLTIKPGNILLNWRKLFERSPELVLAGAGVNQPWLVPFAALYVWNLVWSLAKIEITPAQAITLYALWNAGGRSRRFTESEASAVVNAYRHTCKETPQVKADFARVVNDLVSLRCIELTDGTIWLREWVKKAN